MNYLLHRQNVPHKTAKLPEGLNDLMADISREVLRQQPDQNSIYEYIADYLEALIGTRERAEAIQMIINEQIENTERVRAILRKSGISIDKAEMAARIIQESYKNFVKQKKKKQSIAACDMFDEIAVLRELITKCNLTAEEIVKARPAVKKAYREFIDGYMNAMKASLLGQKVVPLSLVAKIFLDVPSMRQVDKNACVIQSAYRAYMKRKSLRFTSANIKVFLEKIKKRKRDALIAEKTIRLRTTHLDENETIAVKEFQKQYEENVVKQIEAATLIQKVYRGYFIRKDIKLEHTRIVVEKQKSKSLMALVDDEDIQDIFLKGGQDTLADTKSEISLSDMSDSEFQQQITELDLAIKELDAQEQYRNYDREEQEILKRDFDEQVDEFERTEEYQLYTIKEDKEKEEELAIEAVQQDEGHLSYTTTEINTERMPAGDVYKIDRDTEEELAFDAAKICSEKEDDLQSNLSTDYLDTDRMQEEYDMRECMGKEEDLKTRIVVENLEISQELEPDDTALPTERMLGGDATKEAMDIINEALAIDDDIDNEGLVEFDDGETPIEKKDTKKIYEEYEKQFKGEKPFVFPAEIDREFDLDQADEELEKADSIRVTSAINIEEKSPEAVNNVAEISKESLQDLSGPDDAETDLDDDEKSVEIEISTASEDSSTEREQSELAAVVEDGKKELEVPFPVEEVVAVKEQPELDKLAEDGKKEVGVPACVEEVVSIKEEPGLAAVAKDSKKEVAVPATVEEVVSVKEQPGLAAVAKDSKKELAVPAPVEEAVSEKEQSGLATVAKDSKKEVVPVKEQPELPTAAEDDKKVPGPVEEVLSVKEQPELPKVAQDDKKQLEAPAPVEEILSVKDRNELPDVTEDNQKELEVIDNIEDVEKND